MKKPAKKGFTIIELMMVMAIIVVLAAIITPNVLQVVENSRISQTITYARTLQVATEAYYRDMGFYPPDVCRGDDPGFTRTLPYNPDTGGGPRCLTTDGLPANWMTIVQNYWHGPYLDKWPNLTSWNGKYDWNYWPNGQVRYGVVIPAGNYIGVERDYSENNLIPPASEQLLINKGFDIDGQVNGEAQLLVKKL